MSENGEHKYLTFEDIKKAYDLLADVRPIDFCGFPIQLRKSSLFPFEQTYPACDIKTHEEIQIKSGEMIHGIIHNSDAIVSAIFIEQLTNNTNKTDTENGK